MNGFNPKLFWDGRFRTHGHTGESDPILYAYDQQRRLEALQRALTRAGVSITAHTKILDVGCGTGDMIARFSDYYQPEITGIDLSPETIAYTRQRFASNPKVKLLATSLEELDLPAASFDLVIGVNVLQHILEPGSFSQAISRMTGVLQPRGHILVMDFSPIKVAQRNPSPYIVIRSRQDYIDTFNQAGCRLILEYGMPRLGVRFYRWFMAQVARRRPKSPQVTSSTEGQAVTTSAAHPSMGQRIKRALLAFFEPWDRLFAPMPARYTDMRILIFQKF